MDEAPGIEAYALRSFVASQNGQVSVDFDTRLDLLNDDHWYWWYVRVSESREMGYVPFDIVELPNERLARQNRVRNLAFTGELLGDIVFSGAGSKHVHFYDEEYSSDSDIPELEYDTLTELSPDSSPSGSLQGSPIEGKAEFIIPSRAKIIKVIRDLSLDRVDRIDRVEKAEKVARPMEHSMERIDSLKA